MPLKLGLNIYYTSNTQKKLHHQLRNKDDYFSTKDTMYVSTATLLLCIHSNK